MKLKLARHPIEAIKLEGPSRLEGGELFVAPEELEALVGADGPVRLTGMAALHPGERVRAGPVLDVVEPRAKEDTGKSAFPGWTGPPLAVGHGFTRVLSGMAVAAVARLPGAQEGLIDMSPETAPYCPFARTCNLVLLFDSAEGADRLTADHAIRMSLLRSSEFLAGLARGMGTERLETWEWPPAPSDLHRAALLYLVQSQGDLRRTFVYGHPADPILPTLLNPLEVWDGAVVSGNFVLPSNKSCTYIHQNHPIIAEMYQRHGSDFDFAGVILANEMSRLQDKERSAQFAAKLVWLLGAEGALINQEGGGNTVTDLMILCRLLSSHGVKTVLLVNEFAGPDGKTPSLTETTPEAVAIVSAGNNDQPITLPEVERFVGFPPIPGIEGDPAGSVTLPLSRIYASTNQLGFNVLSCRTR